MNTPIIQHPTSEDEHFVHRHQNAEILFYQQVAKGDLDAVEENCRNHEFLNQAGKGRLSVSPLQNLKYHFVVCVSLISRFCVDAGMEMEQSYGLSDRYIQELDHVTSGEELETIYDTMVRDYAGRMKILRQKAGLSKHMTDCMNYIHSHLRDRITIKDLAEYTGTSAGYISRLFKEEMDISASDYIRNTKLESAKNMLRYSDHSLAEIADFYSFTSQSHFSQLFLKETGLTPKKYREKYYGTCWETDPSKEPGANPNAAK